MLSYYASNGHGLGQTLGDGEGQGALACCSPWGQACCSPWGHKELDTTERLNNNRNHTSGVQKWESGGHWESGQRTVSAPFRTWRFFYLYQTQGEDQPSSEQHLPVALSLKVSTFNSATILDPSWSILNGNPYLPGPIILLNRQLMEFYRFCPYKPPSFCSLMEAPFNCFLNLCLSCCSPKKPLRNMFYFSQVFSQILINTVHISFHYIW